MKSKLQRKDTQGQVNEQGEAEGLSCVYFNASSILETVVERRA